MKSGIIPWIMIAVMALIIIARIGSWIKKWKKHKSWMEKRERCYNCGNSDFYFLPEGEWHWQRVKCKKCGSEQIALFI